MLDAGSAKHNEYDEHIKHIPHIESRIICRLINSPYYLGRTYSCVRRDPEKYIKNKQICKLIDEIRYGCGSRKIEYARKHSAKLHYSGFIYPYLNGGNASTIYEFAEKLDLGNAGPKADEIFIPHIFEMECQR